jgi:flagellar motor protein MotB
MLKKAILFIIFSNLFGIVKCLAQTTGKIEVICTFWDADTGADLKSIINGIKNGKKTILAVSDDKQQLLFKSETNIESLIFESKGFSNVNVSLNFIGEFKANSHIKFNLNTLGQLLQGAKTKDYLVFAFPNSYLSGTDYELYRINSGELTFVSNLTNAFEKRQSSIMPLDDKSISFEYVIIAKSRNGETLLKKSFYVKKGLNILDCSLNSSVKDLGVPTIAQTSNQPKNIPNHLGSRVIYFSQSKYDLRREYFSLLDSVADYLGKNQSSKITVMGFTDNVGDKKLNSTLSEYRAKVVANYLIKKGIDEKRIDIKWQDNSDIISSEIDSNTLSKLRKAIISENK